MSEMSKSAADTAGVSFIPRALAREPAGADTVHPWAVAAIPMIAVISVLIDLASPPEIETSIVYASIVIPGLWLRGKPLVFALAALASPLSLAGMLLSEPFVPIGWTDALNRGIGLVAIWTAAYLIGRILDGRTASTTPAEISSRQSAALQAAQARYRKEADKRLHLEDALRHLERVCDASPEPILRFGEDGVLIYANKAGLPIMDAMECRLGQQAAASWCAMIANVLAYDRPQFTELRHDGRIIDVLISPVAETRSVHVFARDMTERRRIESELRRGERRFYAFMESVNMAVVVCRDFSPLYANKAFVRMFGFDHMHDVWRLPSLAPLFDDDDFASIRAAQTKVLGGPREHVQLETRFQRHGVEQGIAECDIYSIDWDGEPAICLTLDDVTLERKSQTRLAEMQRLASLGQMATNIAHELNQPLNIIRMAADGTSELIDEGEDVSRDFLSQKLNTIAAQTSRAASIVEQMRILSHAQAGDMQKIDPVDVVQRSLTARGCKLSAKGIDLRMESGNTDDVVASPTSIDKIIDAVIDNTVDAVARCDWKTRGQKPTFHVSVSPSGERDGTSIKLRDNAGGISTDVIGNIFDPFFTTKVVGQGMGVGLAVAMSLARSMGAEIEARNTGDGAEIELYLPAGGKDQASRLIV